ncbi:MAG: U32 family peptidase, partial [Nanoarchaeota archaeon]|nr:U32 family peptidase [Nanoarchaeota archaeon]
MAPAGSYESLAAAIKAGANSVYFGVGELNMRSRSANFQYDDLAKVIKICKEHNIKSYLTLNTIMYDEDLEQMKKICQIAKEAGITAVIASDISAISYANSIGLEIHISTQANVSNFESAKFYSKFADVIVLARELKLERIKQICQKIKEQNITGPKGELVKIELFAHGALCVSISGVCYMSLAQYGSSANRGACFQACR